MDPAKDNFFRTGCMVCGDELIYSISSAPSICYYCGESYHSNSACSKGHFVCDRCHQVSPIELIEKVCLTDEERDVAVLMQKIRSHQAFSIHGPEHHSLVPAAILAALRNNGVAVTGEMIRTAVQRGQSIPGGACAFLGACGAAIGAGIAYSLLLEANPYNGKTRQIVQQATASILNEVASFNAPRCCQRDSWVALKTVSGLLKTNMDITLPVTRIKCTQYVDNKQCIREKCPLWETKPENREVLYKTWSVCPTCGKRLPAERIRIGQEIFLQKTCVEHGLFSSILWRGYYDLNEWIGEFDRTPLTNPSCPDGCGLCPDHLQKTCCTILNVTSQCNLACRYCFADQGCHKKDPTFEELGESLFRLVDKGKTLLQISGGEPTTREDLPRLIRTAKEAGAKYIQLNTNGIRLGEDEQYVRQLAEAGVSFVFMQFDGMDDTIYKDLRGRPLLECKKQAIRNCARHSIGVTLVTTLVRAVNTENIGEILKFAISEAPDVRGVHFQPVSFMGRMTALPTDDERITLDELIFEIQKQTHGAIQSEHLLPSSCDHPLCGFHGDFVVNNNQLIPLLRRGTKTVACGCDPAAADKNREFVAKRWLRPTASQSETDPGDGDLRDMEYFVKRVSTHGFTVTSMAFQDAGNIDFSRLRNCSLHVYDNGRMVPFCSYYLTGWNQ